MMITLGAVAIVLSVVLAVLAWRCRSWKRGALARLAAGSRVVETNRGPVEYAEVESGPAVLVSHGVLGGYDQGLVVSRVVGQVPYRLVALSRPGYLRTPLAVGRSPEEQADAFAALLDALGIEKAAVLGISGGGPATLQFALRHPERCWAIVLLSAVTRRYVASGGPLVGGLRVFRYLGDFAGWLVAGLNRWKPQWLMRALINRTEMPRLGDPKVLAAMRAMVSSLIPVGPRWLGLENDGECLTSLPAYPLEQIKVPTLVVHGTADDIVPFSHAEFAAAAIRGARLVKLPGGSHFAGVMSGDVVGREVIEFLKEQGRTE